MLVVSRAAVSGDAAKRTGDHGQGSQSTLTDPPPPNSLVEGPLPATLASSAGIQDVTALCRSPPMRSLCKEFADANGAKTK